jgi:hypothetical protein
MADKRDIVTKHNASTEMHPNVMTAQPEKRGWKVAEGSRGHLFKLPDRMYVLHRASCQWVSGKLADAVRVAVQPLFATKPMVFQATG